MFDFCSEVLKPKGSLRKYRFLAVSLPSDSDLTNLGVG